MRNTDFTFLRQRMVSEQIASRGINDRRIIDAFNKVQRHLFVPKSQQAYAYDDCPLPIGYDQTISQPYMVALMTKVLCVEPGMKVLEVGTGSGYQAAILAELGAKVYTIERLSELSQRAQELFRQMGYDIAASVADGTLGWPQEAPFERIIVTAATPDVPPPLLEQLAVSGKLVIPVGSGFAQELMVVNRLGQQVEEEKVCGCVFVPLVGKYGYKE